MVTKPARFVLKDVPRISFFSGGPRCPEDICLPSVLRAITEYTGDPDYGCNRCPGKQLIYKIACSYAFFVGVTGASFYLSWKDGWHDDNVAPWYLDVDAGAMEKQAFTAMGYSFKFIKDEEGKNNQEYYLQCIDASLKRGLPVVSYGVFGPPEAGLITGYDEGGDVLIGWNFFQGVEPGAEFEPSGYYRKRNWAKDIRSLLVIGDKGERPSLKDTYRLALEFGRKVTKTPIVRPEPNAPECYRQRHNGLAAYSAWAEHILRDEDFMIKDEAVLKQQYGVHNNVVGTLAEARWYGSQFLIGMTAHTDTAVHRDAIEDILHAAALYAGEHELMWKLWDLAGGIGNPDGWKKLVNSGVRHQMAPIIIQAREKDVQAVEHLERALLTF